jgi:hypothetical protein
MQQSIIAVFLTFAFASVGNAAHYFATITAVDAEKGTITYKVTSGKDKDKEVKATVNKDCVLKEGMYRLGKPATTMEGDEIADGLKNSLFQKASPEKPLKVDIFTANQANDDKGIKEGDVIKILVNPKP